MTTYTRDVAYIDPTNPFDMLTAHPATNGGASYGTIGVVHGAVLPVGTSMSNDGTSQCVCIEPGRELEVLAALGNKLMGLDPATDDDDQVLVTTRAQLSRLIELIVSKRQVQAQPVVQWALNDLIDLLSGKGYAAVIYTDNEVQVALNG